MSKKAAIDPRQIEEIGGQAFGLLFISNISEFSPDIEIPKYVAIPRKSLTADNLDSLQEDIAQRLFGKGVVCRWSGLRESFSAYCFRGENSTIGNPLSEVNDRFLERIYPWIAQSVRPHHRTLIIQERINAPKGISFHAHGSLDNIAIEFYGDGWSRTILFYAIPGVIFDSRLSNKQKLNSETPILETMLSAASIIATHATFPYNIEGIFSDSKLHISQFRPIPIDFESDLKRSSAIFEILEKKNTFFSTHSIGVYDLTAPIESMKDYLSGKSATYPKIVDTTGAEPQRSAEAMHQQKQKFQRLVELGVPIPRATRAVYGRNQRAIWNFERVAKDLEVGLPIVWLFPDNPFVLQHEVDQLPPLGPMRRAYRRCFLSEHDLAQLRGRTIQIVSDGYIAAACPLG